ncbi:hypothetical protein CQA49_00835 [Helicobacter sp. MIT 00-7814]|uniref:TraB/VirB10 family protein n=1 Tax=unclassified Helicobacter TaxID=2593540 RepID=UPI000E1F0962|nr:MULTISPECIES: TraB/VirB10 family protein [unclassified Helicobacter]RDU55058.1 hypothetical protein CQA37_04425 [Helicobacter sp. MIT 99-10781]RDU56877.1 hypothetical protein CQA49_00835 [Helicobacter sp. MIT 00-7814]
MDKKKKQNIFSAIMDGLKTKTGSALDDMDSRDKIRQSFKESRNKKIIIFVVAAIVIFIILVLISAFNSYKDSQREYAAKEERKSVDIQTDNFAIWQAGAEQRMNDIETQSKQNFTKQGLAIDDIKSSLQDLSDVLIEGFRENKSAIANLNKSIENIEKSTNEKINTIDKEVKGQKNIIDAIKEEIIKYAEQGSDELKNQIKELENKLAATPNVPPTNTQPQQGENTNTAQNENKVGFPTSDENNEPVTLGVSSDGDAIQLQASGRVTRKIKLTVDNKEPDTSGDDRPIDEKEVTFNILLGISKGIILNGADASILGFGRQEEAPVAISLLSKVSIANGEYSNLKDCLLLGSAIGSMTTERAQIRLEKISCIFTNLEGDKFLAEGQVKGWVTDENGQLGVSGGLITQEGRIIRSALPLAAIQTALDYVTRSATNVVIPTGSATGYSNFNAAFGTGSSNAANSTLGKITQIYERMIQAQVPVINFKAGREVAVLFQGGEKITLIPYKDQGLGNEFNSDDIGLGDEKYTYQEDKNAFME